MGSAALLWSLIPRQVANPRMVAGEDADCLVQHRTARQVAEKYGVSLRSVKRLLNQRGGVSAVPESADWASACP
jgi:hypothetical protein